MFLSSLMYLSTNLEHVSSYPLIRLKISSENVTRIRDATCIPILLREVSQLYQYFFPFRRSNWKEDLRKTQATRCSITVRNVTLDATLKAAYKALLRELLHLQLTNVCSGLQFVVF